MNRLIVSIVLVLLLAVSGAFCQDFALAGKKIIEYGWDVPTPDFIRDNITEMEKLPFDGLAFRIVDSTIGMAFATTPWPEESVKKHEAVLKSIKWNKFKHNFLMLYAANDYGMDWYDDKKWEAILQNARTTAKLAKAANCVGVFFDPEPYGKDPWQHPGDYPDKTYEELAKQVRLRGKQWIKALQQEWPDAKVLMFFFDPNMDGQYWIKLLGPFSNGIVEGATNKTTIINGNEFSYYHTTYQQYVNDWKAMKLDGPNLISPELKKKYNRIVQAGMALYMDLSLGLRSRIEDISEHMTEEDRLKYFEATVYWAMKTTDEYVWCYSEKMNWWKGNFPKGADDAIISARNKLESGRGLGYSLQGRLDYAIKALRRAYEEPAKK